MESSVVICSWEEVSIFCKAGVG